MSRHIALIPAAGVGARFGAGKPKQYVEINGQTVLQHTLAVFLAHAQIDHIAVVLSPEDDFFQTASNHKISVLKCGGETRAETVRNGLAALLQQGLAAPHDNILVHDAARCCLPPEALSRLIQEAGGQAEGGILAVPVADTLKRADAAQHIGATVARAGSRRMKSNGCGFSAGPKHSANAAASIVQWRRPNSSAAASGAAANTSTMRPM